jgi:hypothetical protein
MTDPAAGDLSLVEMALYAGRTSTFSVPISNDPAILRCMRRVHGMDIGSTSGRAMTPSSNSRAATGQFVQTGVVEPGD